MTDHKAPGYALEETLSFEGLEQYRALFEETRMQIVDLLMEREATIKDLSEALDKPKGTIGHHVSVLEEAGLIRVVRTEMVRAIEAKYYGRTARTYILDDKGDIGFELAPDHFLTAAAAEFAKAPKTEMGNLSTLRYARIPEGRADEWAERLDELAVEFTEEPRGGEITFGLLLAIYPTDRPHLPDAKDQP